MLFCQENILLFNVTDYNLLQVLCINELESGRCVSTHTHTHQYSLLHMHISEWIQKENMFFVLDMFFSFCIFYSVPVFLL